MTSKQDKCYKKPSSQKKITTEAQSSQRIIELLCIFSASVVNRLLITELD